MPIQIMPFRNELLPEAAELLARRHTKDRISLSVMPSRFEDPLTAQKSIEAALKRKHAYGFAAVDAGRLVAYLIGDMVIDDLWERSGWIQMAGCAYNLDVDVEIVRDLYAALGARWVDYGIFSHFALIPVTDTALVHAWFSLSFGIQQVHALVDLEALNPVLPSIPPEIEIRKVETGDRQQMAKISDVIWKVQVKAPVWAVMMPEKVRVFEEGWADTADDPEDGVVWLALMEGKLVGLQGYWPAEETDENMLIPERCAELGIAGTREEERGKGIGTLLTKYGFARARSAGYRFCETDWRSTNLLSSRFWPRQGFRPAFYRLVRRLDQRIAWADGVVSH